MIEGWAKNLKLFLQAQTGSLIDISRPKQLSGGAIQENWSIDISVKGGNWAGEHHLVLRTDSTSTVRSSHSRIQEFNLLKVAYNADVLAPKPYFLCEDEAVIGRTFFLMKRYGGIAAGHKLVKYEENPGLLYQIGKNLARIHTIKPQCYDLPFLKDVPENPVKAAIDLYRQYLDLLSDPHPAIEWGLVWLELNSPPVNEVVLCHRDFRTGNLLIDKGELTAILDWEFSGWGDPHEDVFWFTAKCWRFGANHKPAGGLGQREDFYRGYEESSGREINRGLEVYWEVMAHVRWAIIACQQSERQVSGAENSLELALTGHVVPELELEILSLTKGW